MAELKKALIEEQKHMEGVIKEILMRQKKVSEEKVPEGRLRVSVDNGYARFYRCTDTDNKGTYIKRGELDIARRLAQKEYDSRVLVNAKRRLRQINAIITDYEDNEIDSWLYREHAEKQKLIKPVERTWEEQLKEWIGARYEGKELWDDKTEIYTQKGERVRSKSEKILADYFYYHNIAYKYECPLRLKGFGTVYPDFTFLSKKKRKEIYWEHNGMMDDPAYAKKAIKKLEAYEKNGIFPGEGLILTFETGQASINNEIIERMAERYLL